MTAQWQDDPGGILPNGFRVIEGYFGEYIVSDKGEVRSRYRSGRTLKPSIDSDGYYRVALTGPFGRKMVRVHRLVAEAFVPNPLGKAEVNHINRIKADNRADNLEWATRKENIRHWRSLQYADKVAHARDVYAASILGALLAGSTDHEKTIEYAFKLADRCMVARARPVIVTGEPIQRLAPPAEPQPAAAQEPAS